MTQEKASYIWFEKNEVILDSKCLEKKWMDPQFF